MMAPNVWIPSTKTLQRPLRLADPYTSILTSISHPDNENAIHVRLHDTEYISPNDQRVILEQVARMLRISDRDERDVKQFHQIQPEAKNKCFGRIFRSPSIFEDMVKSILLCNAPWRRTLDMAQALCELQFELKGHKRKRVTNPRSKAKNSADEVQSIGNFPNSMELNILDEETLKKRCNLGYRAKIILELATSIENGEVKLQNFEKALDAESMEKIYDMLNKKKGFGPFACANILMCIGYYQRIPTDSETFRHVKEV
ncbi:unnamed protein product, partial [Vitis vinifera]|uniref:HhH-GPD domain-containing protein n=1 Tax=Vitis vinifera TaxID=29760 RepID=D7TXU0_VITVI